MTPPTLRVSMDREIRNAGRFCRADNAGVPHVTDWDRHGLCYRIPLAVGT